MERIDFGIEANFQGREVRLAKTNGENIRKLQEEFDKLNELGELTKEYEQQRENIIDSDKPDEEKEKRLEGIAEDFNSKTEKFKESIKEHRKAVCNIMIEKWLDGEPEDDFYSDDNFDDFELNRLVTFFLTPKGATLSKER